MGANAQTSVPSFADGQVLTGQQQTEINTGIPVFATSVERDAAFGGTGEKVLAEGQYAYLEDTNATQVYDGSTWQSVGIAPGLVCVKAETAFSAVASFTVDNVFTSDYTNYLMLMTWTVSIASQPTTVLRVGGVDATSNYNYQRGIAQSTSISNDRYANQSSILCASFTYAPSSFSAMTLTIYQPQLATTTFFNAFNAATDTALTVPRNDNFSGNHNAATAYDGIKFAVPTGTFTGTYAIYGYSKTV